MKKRLFLSPKFLLSCIVLLLCSILLTLFLLSRRQDEKQFTKLTRDLFVEEMTANTLNMHYSLAYPENFGIHDYTPVLPIYEADAEAAVLEATQDTIVTLKKINRWNLTETDARTYEQLLRLLENSRQLKSFTYYENPLSPSSGIQSQLPILLAEYAFRSKRDVEDYLALLDQTDTYLASLLTYEQEKADAGFPMSSYSYRLVKKQCDTIVTKLALEEETHFLQTTFEERLATLLEQNIITTQEADYYVSQNNRLLRTVVQPAYEALADGMFLLEDAENAQPLPTGLASLPEGKDYYCCLLISETGSYRPPEEVRELLQTTLQKEYDTLCSLLRKYPEINLTDGAIRLSCEEPDNMLQDLQNRMEKDFPANQTASCFPNITIKAVSPDLEDYCAPAFYLTAPLDDTDANVIYINHKNTSTGLDLYTTLAHEGYPGHLYQTVYNNQNVLNRGDNPIRQLMWYGGYLEGWALYVEFFGYDYATKQLLEEGRKEDAIRVQLEKHNRSLLLCLYSSLDLMIHYDNASREDVAKALGDFGISSPSAANAIYNYIADEPCNYLKYYLGYLEILELKEKAKKTWGEDYSDLAFHTFFLDAGPSDFISLNELIH